MDLLDFMKRAASDPEVADPIASKIKELETRLEQEQRARLEMVQQQQLAYVDTSVTEAQRIFVGVHRRICGQVPAPREGI